MSRHVSVLTTVYASERAEKQKRECFDFFISRNPANAQEQHTLLYEGINSFLSRNPFVHPSTQPLDGVSDGYIAKLSFGTEPLYITIVFTDNYADGRQLQGISIAAVSGEIIFP